MLTVDIENIKPNPSNPRIIKDDKFKKLVKSLEDFPQMLEKRPLVCFTDTDGKYVVLGGNMRLKASQEVGLIKLPIVLTDDWNDEQRKEFLIKDNIGFGEWDFDMLANEWDVEELQEWGLEIPDFKIIKEAFDDEYEVPTNIETNIVIGDIIEIGQHRLLCGDSTNADDVSRLVNGNICDIVFTDPPHDFSDEQHQEVLNNCILFSTGDIFILSANDKLLNLCFNNKEVFNDFLVHDFVFHIGGGHNPLRQYDLIAHFRKTKFYNLNDGFSNCIRVNSMRMGGYVNEKVHDHQKHIDLYAAFYKHYSLEEQSVLDLFGGSGTAMVAGEQLNRRCYLMENNPINCQIILDRMKKIKPEIRIFKNGVLYE